MGRRRTMRLAPVLAVDSGPVATPFETWCDENARDVRDPWSWEVFCAVSTDPAGTPAAP